jgi:hypothetical protein
MSLCALEKNYFYVNFAHIRKCISIEALWKRSIAECLDRRTVNADVSLVQSQYPPSGIREVADETVSNNKNVLKNPEKNPINICLRSS